VLAKSKVGGEKMRSPITYVVLLIFFTTSNLLAQIQEPAGTNGASSSASASKEEVNELRKEIAAQRKTIDELTAVVKQLAETKAQVAETDSEQTNLSGGDGVRLLNANLVEQAKPAQAAAPDKKPADKKTDTPATAGWNGEHFFIKSTDGQFQLMPYGYFQTDYRAYKGDGAPPNTFLMRRVRFGFQGNYGKYYDFAVLLDSAAGNGISLRDLYINVKPIPEFQVQVGQYKVPFNQETLISAPNLDFVERSLASLIYPSASTAYRTPGLTIHGDIWGGIMQYWLGAFNGKGILQPNTTNEPEIVGRLRFYPWRKKKNHMFQGFAIGGSIDRGRTRGLSNEMSFTATEPDNAFTFFPSFRINGTVERYNGEFTWTHGPWGVRGEYDQLLQKRVGVGSEQAGGLGFTTLPGVIAKTGYGSITYLLTGENRPENGTPKVKHPFLGPVEGSGGKRGYGAFELGFRYSRIQAKEPGESQLTNPLTPGFVTTFDEHTDQFTGGINWYLNYWVKYQFNLSVDRLTAPSVAGQVPQNFFVFLNRMQFRF
jgi:phosphate-selective porin/molybdopterin converting factor small subunit